MRLPAGSWVRPRHRRAAAIDVGLQAERTAMAWQRTALGIGGVSALLLHLADRQGWAAVPGAAGLLLALGLLLLTERRYEQSVTRAAAGDTPARPAMLLAVAAGAVALAAAALVLVIAVPG